MRFFIPSLLMFSLLIGGQSVLCLDFKQEDLFFRGLDFFFQENSEEKAAKEEAFACFKLAADKGLVNAQCIVAFMYLKGIGVPRDEQEAFKWYHLAAEVGCIRSQYAVGILQFNGIGTLIDQEQGIEWCKSAEINGLKPADKITIEEIIGYSLKGKSKLEQTISGVDFNTLRMLRKAIFHSNQSKGKDIVAVIGNTGVGKSTAINDFTGHRIVCDESTGKMKVKDENELAEIGHSPVESKTLYTQIYPNHPLPYSSFILADCGGFLDTREGCEIAASSSLKLTLQNAKSVKIILCFDANSIKSDRMVHFCHSLKTCFTELIKDYTTFPDATMLMITKPPRYEVIGKNLMGPYNLESAIRDLETARSYLKEGSLMKALFDHILREDGKYIAIYDPTVQETKEHVMEIINEMEAIDTPKDAFKIAYSPQVRLDLTNVANKIAFKYVNLCKELPLKRTEINQVIDAFYTERSDLIEMNDDLELIKKGLEKTKRELKAFINQQESNLAALNKERQEAEERIINPEKRLEDLNCGMLGLVLCNSESWLLKEISNDAKVIIELDKQIEDLNLSIKDKKDSLRIKNHEIESLEQWITKLGQIKENSKLLISQATRFLFEIIKIKEQIHSNDKNFTFLEQYLDLNHDTELDEQEIILEFISLRTALKR